VPDRTVFPVPGQSIRLRDARFSLRPNIKFSGCAVLAALSLLPAALSIATGEELAAVLRSVGTSS